MRKQGQRFIYQPLTPKTHSCFGIILQGMWKRCSTSVHSSPECSTHSSHPETEGRGSCISAVNTRILTNLCRCNQQLGFSNKICMNTFKNWAENAFHNSQLCQFLTNRHLSHLQNGAHFCCILSVPSTMRRVKILCRNCVSINHSNRHSTLV